MGKRCKQTVSSQSKKSSIDHWQFPGPSIYWESITRKISHSAIEYYISKSVDGLKRSKISQGPLQETINIADTAQSWF